MKNFWNIRSLLPQFSTFFFFLGIGTSAIFAQLPPLQAEQDCIGAIPICQNIFVQPNSYVGEGLNPNEINNSNSCLGTGERNSTWYRFTTQVAGVIGFSISPVDPADDYDWAVYNLTNNGCAAIATNPSLEVSCNYSGVPGVTGPNGLPGFQNEPVINVNAGETYVINVSNFTGSVSGYTIDFSVSTASLLGSGALTMDSAFVACGSSQINVLFSTPIVCNSVDPTDFTVSGPGGPYAVTAVSGIACSLGQLLETNFQLETSPAISLPGSYTVSLIDSITDLCGNILASDTVDAFIDPNDPVVNIQLAPTITQPNCSGIGGMIEVAVIGGGTAPYTFDWSTGAQDSILTGVPPGGYALVVQDSNNCAQQEVYILEYPDSCFVSVSGTAFYDLNGNCIQESNEQGIPYFYIDVLPGTPVFTDLLGNYEVLLDTGLVGLIADPSQPNYFVANCPANGMHTLSLSSYFSDSTGIDFAMGIQPVQDLRVAGGLLVAVNGGFSYSYLIQVFNEGSVSLPATLTWEHDSLVSFDSSSVIPTSYDTLNRLVTWQLDTLIPGQILGISVHGIADTSVGIGAPLVFTSTVLPIVGDTTPNNNVSINLTNSVGAFDPNDKQVSPRGIGELGLIEASENEMTYTVRFQNTGNFPAQFVVIRDTISPNLDISEFVPMVQSHPYTLAVEEDSILIFTFADIQLPDSTSDPQGSQGMVSFQLRHQSGLQPGDQIRNSAAIYFDFNAPIITNEVLNTIYAPLAMGFVVDSIICSSGDSIQGMLTQTGLSPYDYSWSTGDQLLSSSELSSTTTISSSGYYVLTITDALGISVSDSIFIEIAPLPIAQADTSVQDFEVQFLDLSQNANGWFWDFGDGQTSTEPSPTHTYQTNGSFDVSLVVSNVCGTDTLFLTIEVSGPISSIDDPFARSVETIPNPFSHQTLIRFSNPQQRPFALVVMDMQGKIVRSYQQLRTDEIIIERGNLSRGMYIFHLRGEKSQHIGKLMVE